MCQPVCVAIIVWGHYSHTYYSMRYERILPSDKYGICSHIPARSSFTALDQ
ncbi:predicted protein [Plenodomus lingam JN3]|uniref:Predicted protein n=1 Tax=Leptosphaeria maculans (strain JN3 / isolate v23.1.3 / race Av1-4-5-6-7-8) TaxID=985895 RepID=E4ZVK2_LEPMJ|nr:predicted protein [Plenodomus lingam JN3]CBX95628.1 predicted protein [Plenodomus lingam JN3]